MVCRSLPLSLLTLALSLASIDSPVSAQTVDEIVLRHAAARGGAERWQTVHTMRMTGRIVTGPGREALIVREIKRPGKVRTEFTFQGTTGVFAWDGSRGWQVSPLTGVFEPQPLSREDARAAIEQADLEGPLVPARRRGATVTLVDHEAVSGRDAVRLRVTPKSGPPTDYWVDAETHLVLKSLDTRQVRGQRAQVETLWADYRTVAGLVMPHTLEMGVVGQPDRLRITIESVEVNPPIADGQFRAPRGTPR
jgi:outer membrane lipoprotein-sorting protein